MNWSGEQFKCRNCGEVYPYRISTCPCGGVCDKISDALQEAASGLDIDCSVLTDILEDEQQKERERKQKEQERCKNWLRQLFSEVKDACSKNDYATAISYLEKILAILPDSMEAKKLLDFCTERVEQQLREEEANRHAGKRKTVTVNGVEFAFRWCPAGTFMMGSPKSEEGRDYNETRHSVTLTKGFWMMETEVTQKQWIAIMGDNPSSFKGDNLPIEQISWNDCQEFCKECTQLGLPVQLPTEAQWEYACRAGSTTAYFWGDALNGDNANTNGNYPCGTTTIGKYLGKTTPVGSYQPNAWGLYDMHGNVLELCQDWYGDYPSGSVTDPAGPSSGSCHVIRGGSWCCSARSCRSANRSYCEPGYCGSILGFRCVNGQ